MSVTLSVLLWAWAGREAELVEYEDAVLPYVAVYLPEVLVDLVLVVPAHHLREVAGWSVFEKIAELGVNFRLHMA